VLRAVADSDLPVFFEHQRDEAARHMAAFVSEDGSDRGAFDAHWARIRDSDKVLVRTIVVEEKPVGHIASFDRDGDHEVTYWIGREHWGQGIATRALTAFLAEDAVRPMFGRVVKDGAASRRVLEKCGFRLHGEDKGYAAGRGAEVEEFILRLD
jgi:RimJ/RimL family protein N-acetyltransferase